MELYVELHFICNPSEHKVWQKIDYNNVVSKFSSNEDKKINLIDKIHNKLWIMSLSFYHSSNIASPTTKHADTGSNN